ncbi:sensor histidine kinase [Luteibacter sp. 3190]|uniref:sensor histidine kinase n=1 Tax=Luteibacter sp. 3190 TaxID=2817736 RepID=UPI0028579837|nr:sensor histidine kinase [Luteibacter sp. 3190]MDR6934972.1 two-component system sensor histidine kinase DesK [Luteibacter sp. 3190]
MRSWFRPAPGSLWSRFRGQPRLRIASMFHLVWTVYVFGDLVFRNDIGPYWILATALSFPMFLFLYAQAYLRPVAMAPWLALLVALLGYATMGFNASGGGCYVIYACAMLGFDGAPRRCLASMAAVLAGFVAIAWFVVHWPYAAIATVSFIAFGVGTINVVYRYNAERDVELKLSHDEIRRLAATAERERIGRDLHDLLGHTLSLITLKLELSRRLADRDPVAAKREVEEAEQVARHALAEVRSAVTGIRASGLVAELAAARLLLISSQIEFVYANDLPDVPARIDNQLALVLREAVTNIHRHARATYAEVSLVVDARTCILTVRDDGRGVTGDEGNGICGMRERVRSLGGTLAFESGQGKGTSLRIEVPLRPEDRALPPQPAVLPGTHDRLAS